MGFSQVKYVSLKKKPTLSADKVGFSLMNPVHLNKPILSAHADKDSFPDKPTLRLTNFSVS